MWVRKEHVEVGQESALAPARPETDTLPPIEPLVHRSNSGPAVVPLSPVTSPQPVVVQQETSV